MKDIFKNKRIMFPVIICIVVIAIAILVFIILSIDIGNNKRVDNVVFDNISTGGGSTNVTTTENTVDDDDKQNKVSNTTKPTDDDDDDDEVEFGGEQFYLDTAEDFVRGLMDEDDMRSFVDNHVDVQAYIACYNVGGDDSKFMDEYNSINFDDDDRDKVMDMFAQIANLSDAKLTALTDPRQSGDNEIINRVTLTIKSDEDIQKIRMVFYDQIVIYIYDENGDSIINLD